MRYNVPLCDRVCLRHAYLLWGAEWYLVDQFKLIQGFRYLSLCRIVHIFLSAFDGVLLHTNPRSGFLTYNND